MVARLDLVVEGGMVGLPARSADNDVRVLAALAAAKLGRGDRLIGLHLTMELMRACLVQAMLLRDRDGGTSVHRFGSGRDEMADQVAGLLRCEVGVSPRPNVVERTVELYGQWHRQLDDGYQPNWSGLDTLIARGRAGDSLRRPTSSGADEGDRIDGKFEQYVHGYLSQENQRLNDQAGTLVELLHSDTGYPPGAAVLEVGCGVGAQTLALAERSPGAALTCVDISAQSLAEARQRAAGAGLDQITFLQADVFDLPDPDGPLSAGRFDHVFICFLLEHLSDPAGALVRLRAMLKPGGTITVIEGDHGSTYFHPESQAARDAITCQITLQRLAGGDALIGRRLYPLLTTAGYHHVSVSPRQVYVDASRPSLVDGFTRKTFTAMIDGIRQPALDAGLIDARRFDDGIRDLLRTTEPDGVFCYTFFKAVAAH